MFSDCDLDHECGKQCLVQGTPSQDLSVKFIKFDFLSNPRDRIRPLTPDCDLDLQFGNINIVCDILSRLTFLCSLKKFASVGFKLS